MKILKNVFFIALMLLSFTAFSQNGFIEVEVIDSVQVKATSFEYIVALEEDYETYVEDAEADQNINEMKVKNQDKMRLTTLENFLKNNKYMYASLSDSNYEINGKNNLFRMNSNGFMVTLPSLEALKKIASEIKEMTKVTGTISKINYDTKSIQEEELLKKLIEKGKIKAQSIAKLSNLTLGKILEVREVKQVENANFNFMDMIMKLDKKRNFGLASDIQNSNHTKALVIKFTAN